MIIGLGGYATAGKDAVADILVEQHGWQKTYMSKPLERALLTLNPVVPVYLDDEGVVQIEGAWERYADLHARVGYERSKKNPEVRRLLQVLGTEVGRKQFDDDLWVRLAFKEVDALHLGEGHDVAITGIRYPNELEALHYRFGIAVWVDRPGTRAVNGHSSESTLKPRDFDAIISNDGDLDDLVMAVRQFLGRG